MSERSKIFPFSGGLNWGFQFVLYQWPYSLESPVTSVDPYDAFLAEQEKREADWASNRANKKAKTMQTADKDWEAIKHQLAAKEAECATIKGQLDSLQRANISVVEAVNNKVQENFCKVSAVIKW